MTNMKKKCHMHILAHKTPKAVTSHLSKSKPLHRTCLYMVTGSTGLLKYPTDRQRWADKKICRQIKKKSRKTSSETDRRTVRGQVGAKKSGRDKARRAELKIKDNLAFLKLSPSSSAQELTHSSTVTSAELCLVKMTQTKTNLYTSGNLPYYDWYKHCVAAYLISHTLSLTCYLSSVMSRAVIHTWWIINCEWYFLASALGNVYVWLNCRQWREFAAVSPGGCWTMRSLCNWERWARERRGGEKGHPVKYTKCLHAHLCAFLLTSVLPLAQLLVLALQVTVEFCWTMKTINAVPMPLPSLSPSTHFLRNRMLWIEHKRWVKGCKSYSGLRRTILLNRTAYMLKPWEHFNHTL